MKHELAELYKYINRCAYDGNYQRAIELLIDVNNKLFKYIEVVDRELQELKSKGESK